MVTASHNPPQDNGYKVYLGDGSQIVPPADADIAAPHRGRRRPRRHRRGARPGTVLGEDIVDHYLDTVAGLADDGPRDLDIVYTPLHGVGGTSVVQVLETAGLRRPAGRAPSRSSPTPTSRPSPSPTPRSRARWTSRWPSPSARGADLVVANDPDADRCAAAVPGPAGLADAARRRGRRAARPPPARRRQARHLRHVDRLLVAAGQDGRRRRPAVRRDPHRLQVDRPGRRTSPSATRRRWATASTPSTSATRTASRRCCCSASSPPSSRPRAARCATSSTTSPPSTACTPPTRCRCGSTTWR